MNRNWYAVALLFVLILSLFLSGWYMHTTLEQLDTDLNRAFACAEAGDYRQARQNFLETADKAEQCSHLWVLLVRRSLIDQLNQTLATIPSYATAENHSDLAVETARARAQARQIRQSFFSCF